MRHLVDTRRDSSYTPAFMMDSATITKEHPAMAVQGLDRQAALGFEKVDCALSSLDASKADGAEAKMAHHDIKHLMHRADSQALATASLIPAAQAGVAAITVAQLGACADQTALLQNQQLQNDLTNLLAATGSTGPSNFQLAAIQSRTLQITQVNLAQKSGIAATGAAVVNNFLAYGLSGYGGFGYGIGGPLAVGGYGFRGGTVASNVGAGCCGR